jgi:hypothetical protein
MPPQQTERNPQEDEGIQPYPWVDPNTGTASALQGTAVVLTGAGLALASGGTGTAEAALAAFAFNFPHSLSLGLGLIAVGLVANVVSLALRFQRRKATAPPARSSQ